MLYNKNIFYKYNDKKILHKVKKQWVTVSLALFMMIGGGAIATQASASTNKINNIPTDQIVNSSGFSKDVPSPQQSSSVSNDAKNVSNDVSNIKTISSSVSNYINEINDDYQNINNLSSQDEKSYSYNESANNSLASDSYSGELMSSIAINDNNSISSNINLINSASGDISNEILSISESASQSSSSSYVSEANSDDSVADLNYNLANVTLSMISSADSVADTINHDAENINTSLSNSASNNSKNINNPISEEISENASDINSYISSVSTNNTITSSDNVDASSINSVIQSVNTSTDNVLSSYASNANLESNTISSANSLISSVRAKMISYSSSNNVSKENYQNNLTSESIENDNLMKDDMSISSYADSISDNVNNAVSQANSALDKIHSDLLNVNNFNNSIIDPSKINNDSVSNAITHAEPGDIPGIITLNNNGQPVRYVINVKPGQYIKLDNGKLSKIEFESDNTIYAYDPSTGQIITNFKDVSSLPTYDNVETDYNIYPKLKFVYDNGDGTYSTDTDYEGLNFNSQYMDNGVLSVPLNISGHYDEPHDISYNDIDGNGTTLYPHFQLDTQNLLNPDHLVVVLGKGLPNAKNTAENDNGHYWLNGQNTVTMMARRYFAHVVYKYNGHCYDLPDNTPTGTTTAGFAGDSVDIYDKFNQAVKSGLINSNLMISPHQSFTLDDKSSKSHPQIVYVQLTPKTNTGGQMPVVLADYDQRNNPDATKYLAMVDLNNMSYGQPYSYNIQRNTIHPQSGDPLNNSYLVSAGTLSSKTDIEDNVLQSNWTDIDDYVSTHNGNYYNPLIQKLNDSYNNSDAVNVGSYVLLSGPYSGQIVPIIYFKKYTNNGYNDFINIPGIRYNYRFWGPADRSGNNDATYDKAYVNNMSTVRNPYNSNNESANNLLDSSNNAYNFMTWHNLNLTGMSGNAAPTGFISQMEPWNTSAQGFKEENNNNPANDWYVQFVRDSKDKNKVDTNVLACEENNPNNLCVTNSPYSDKAPIQYMGIADGNGAGQELDTDNNGNVSVTLNDGNGHTVTYPRNATILWDNDAHTFCPYEDNDKNGGQYYYGNGKTPIYFKINKQQSIQNGYIGDMNTYAQPVSYGVKFLGSGNYLNYNQKTIQESNEYPKNKNYIFPNYTKNTYTPNTSENSPERAYAGDQISFNSKDGTFYLKYMNSNNGNYKPVPLLSIPKYNTANVSSKHQLVYDRNYESSYLSHLLSAEKIGHQININSGDNRVNGVADPEWTLGVGNLALDIWPDGSDLTNGEANDAVVYLADQQIKAYNKIHFVSLDTGMNEAVSIKGQNVQQEIQSLFSKNGSNSMKFDMSDFLRNFMYNEANSTFDKGDGSWELQTPISDGKYSNIWIVRTDSPKNPNNLNNTFIYVASQDFNNPKYWGSFSVPVTVHYVSTNGSKIDNGSHDFTVKGFLHNETVDQAMKEYNESLWPYLDQRYQEVGLLPGDFQPNSSTDTPGNDYNNYYLHDDKNIFGTTPSITIVLKKLSNNVKTFHVQFIDDNANPKDLSSNDVYENNIGSSTGKVSSTTANKLDNSISNLINSGYQVTYYNYNNGQKQSINSTENKTEISDLENMLANNSNYRNQNIAIHLNHQNVSYPETKTITENIHYIVNGNSKLNPAPSTQYVIFTRTNVKDKVTGKIKFGSWQFQSAKSNVSSLSDKVSPTVNGYHTDNNEIYAPRIDMSNLEKAQNTYNYDVYYYPNTPNVSDNSQISGNRFNKRMDRRIGKNVEKQNKAIHHKEKNINDKHQNKKLKKSNKSLKSKEKNVSKNVNKHQRNKTYVRRYNQNHVDNKHKNNVKVTNISKGIKEDKTNSHQINIAKSYNNYGYDKSANMMKYRNDKNQSFSKNYVDGIDDARRGLSIKNHNHGYAKGYNTFKRANGGKLPQTGENNNHITLAVAMLMVFALLFKVPATIDKRK